MYLGEGLRRMVGNQLPVLCIGFTDAIYGACPAMAVRNKRNTGQVIRQGIMYPYSEGLPVLHILQPFFRYFLLHTDALGIKLSPVLGKNYPG